MLHDPGPADTPRWHPYWVLSFLPISRLERAGSGWKNDWSDRLRFGTVATRGRPMLTLWTRGFAGSPVAQRPRMQVVQSRQVSVPVPPPLRFPT